MFGFIGPNGAGKTTTLDLIMSMGREDAGTIHVLGLDHRKDEVAMKRQVGYVSPYTDFSSWGKLHRIVRFFRGFYPDWDDAYCEHLLNALELGADKRIRTLSFGEKTRLALVLALAHRPAVLLLDEPFLGLDAVSKRLIFSELLGAAQDQDRTVIISAHGLDDIERLTDHIGIIHRGRMLLEGPTPEVVEQHRMIEVAPRNGMHVVGIDGIRLRERSDDRLRLLVNLKQCPLEKLRAEAEVLSDVPVTLEDLFVALVTEPGQ
jgi:ABC-2 type transport system ATP-binding protein